MTVDVKPIVVIKPHSSYGSMLTALEQVMAIFSRLSPEEKRKLALAINALVAP